MSSRSIITKFGGIRPMADKLGHRSHTTVQGWWDRDIIPAARQREVLAVAGRCGIPLSADQLVRGEAAVEHCPRCSEHVTTAEATTCASDHCPMRIADLEEAAA